MTSSADEHEHDLEYGPRCEGWLAFTGVASPMRPSVAPEWEAQEQARSSRTAGRISTGATLPGAPIQNVEPRQAFSAVATLSQPPPLAPRRVSSLAPVPVYDYTKMGPHFSAVKAVKRSRRSALFSREEIKAATAPRKITKKAHTQQQIIDLTNEVGMDDLFRKAKFNVFWLDHMVWIQDVYNGKCGGGSYRRQQAKLIEDLHADRERY